MNFVTSVTVVDMLHLMISCLTGIGALCISTTVVVVLYAIWVMRRWDKPKQTETPAVDWEAELNAAIERAQRDAW